MYYFTFRCFKCKQDIKICYPPFSTPAYKVFCLWCKVAYVINYTGTQPYVQLVEKESFINMLTASFTWQYNLSMYKLTFDQIQGGLAWKALKELLDIIKGTIPAGSHRDYDPQTKEWFIHPDYEFYIQSLLESKLGKKNVFFFKKPDETPANISKNLTVQDELKIFSKLSEVSIQELEKLDRNTATKLYRKLAAKYHPDRNPNNGPIMSELNMVWNSLKEGYYIK